MLDKKILSEIEKIGISIDHNVAFSGKSKGNKHLYRVVKIAAFIAENMHANLPLVEAAAYLHDTALPSGDDYNYESNKKIIQNLIKKLDLTEEEKSSIAECVASHEGTGGFESVESKIIHDADVIEKTGILGIIRHTWKMSNSGKIDFKNVTDENIEMILDHIKWRYTKLQTPLGRKIGKYLTQTMSQETATEVIRATARLAYNGVITEKIAMAVNKFLNHKEKDLLASQLNLSYLRRLK